MNEYLSKIEATVQTCFLMAAYQLKIDRKTQDMAFIAGQIDFVDGSTLDFKEFVERTDEEIKLLASHAVSLEEVLAEILQHVLQTWEH